MSQPRRSFAVPPDPGRADRCAGRPAAALPAHAALSWSSNPVSTLMLWRWATGARVERTWVPLAAIAPALPRTVIASEDARFCTHRGVDFSELRAAIEDADDLSEMRGGSTIAQQTAKNLFLWPGPLGRAQGAGVPARALDRPRPRQAAGDGDLSQHRRMGAERASSARRRPPPRLQQVRPRPVGPRGGAACLGPAEPAPPQRRQARPRRAPAGRDL